MAVVSNVTVVVIGCRKQKARCVAAMMQHDREPRAPDLRHALAVREEPRTPHAKHRKERDREVAAQRLDIGVRAQFAIGHSFRH